VAKNLRQKNPSYLEYNHKNHLNYKKRYLPHTIWIIIIYLIQIQIQKPELVYRDKTKCAYDKLIPVKAPIKNNTLL
jgi:hypothetical protein